MAKYMCTILRTYGEPYNLTQHFRTLELDELRPTFNHVKKLNRRYINRKIRYTVEIVKQI